MAKVVALAGAVAVADCKICSTSARAEAQQQSAFLQK